MRAQVAKLLYFDATYLSPMFANTTTEGSSNGNHPNKQGVCMDFCKVCGPVNNGRVVGRTTTTICMLEKVFPSSFFDVMYVLYANSLSATAGRLWASPHMMDVPSRTVPKTWKGYVWQSAQLEGSMARGYIMDDALGFCIEYMQNCSVMTCCVWDDKRKPSRMREF